MTCRFPVTCSRAIWVDEGFLDIPVRWSIAEIQAAADTGGDVTLMPSRSALLAQIVNASNSGTADFEQVYYSCPSTAFLAIVTAAKSKLISFTSELRRSLSSSASLDNRKLPQAVERASVVVIGDNNMVATDTAQTTAQRTRWWQPLWVKIVGGCSVVAVGVVIEEVWRRSNIWPF